MPDINTEALVLHCIDFRIQKHLDAWLQKHLGYDNYDRVSLAGGVFDFETVTRQIEISEELHQIKKVIIINHQNCGAYEDSGKDEASRKDLIRAQVKLEEVSGHLSVEAYFLHLDGTFEQVINT